MRKSYSDLINDVFIIGSDIVDVYFMKYLLYFKTINSSIYPNVDIDEEQLKKIITFSYNAANNTFTLEFYKLFDELMKKHIPFEIENSEVFSENVITSIDRALQSDAVYICNRKPLGKDLMYMLGYFMAKKHEIFFWENMPKDEVMFYSIIENNIKNNHGLKEIEIHPMEFAKFLAFSKITYDEILVQQYFFDEFSIPVADPKEIIPGTVSFLGSLKKHLSSIKDSAASYKDNGYRVLGPNISKVVNVDNGFVIFEDDKNEDPIIIEADFLKKCLESEEVFVCDKGGYCGSTVAFEIGYLQGMGKVIKQMESFRENWLNEVINHYNNFNKKYSKKIDKII